MSDTHYIKNKKNRDFYFVNYLAWSIPTVLLFDWLFNLQIIQIQLGLFFKGLTIVLALNYHITRTQNYIKSKFIRILVFFIFLNLSYSFFSSNFENNIYLCVRIIYWVIVSSCVYQLFLKQTINFYRIRVIFLRVVWIGSIFTLYLMSISEKHQNGSAYILLWCFPILLYLRQDTYTRLAQILCLIAIFATLKRGAMLALSLSFISYVLAKVYVENDIKKIFRILIVGVLFLFTGIITLLVNKEMFLERLEDKTGSGRDIVYSFLSNKYISGDAFNLVFGYGINSVQENTGYILSGHHFHSGAAAHSDFLQYTFDFGMFGIIFMLSLHLYYLKNLNVHFKLKSKLLPSYIMLYVIFFMTTIYSFILNVPDAIFLGITSVIFEVETFKIKYGFS